MALRDATTGRLLVFTACAKSGFTNDPAIVRLDADWGSRERIDRSCPTHGGTWCVDTYIARSRLASMSLLDLWRWRRAWRRTISEMEGQ